MANVGIGVAAFAARFAIVLPGRCIEIKMILFIAVRALVGDRFITVPSERQPKGLKEF